MPGVHQLKVVGDRIVPDRASFWCDLGPKLSPSLEEYLRHEGQGKSKGFFNMSRRAYGHTTVKVHGAGQIVRRAPR